MPNGSTLAVRFAFGNDLFAAIGFLVIKPSWSASCGRCNEDCLVLSEHPGIGARFYVFRQGFLVSRAASKCLPERQTAQAMRRMRRPRIRAASVNDRPRAFRPS